MNNFMSTDLTSWKKWTNSLKITPSKVNQNELGNLNTSLIIQETEFVINTTPPPP